ncbi:imelysin family protein [Paracoccaceae bacterium Fryx2]|nr:imelysin family protein [Paracoccaceae bacterium Fryx2]
MTAHDPVKSMPTIKRNTQMTSDSRLARPMGTFERPRPRLAEAWRSGRSLRNVVLAAEAAHAFAHSLADGALPRTDAALEDVLAAAARITDPGFQDVGDPQARLRIEVLQQSVRAMHSAIEVEIGAALDIVPGFNSLDGD